MGKTNDDVISFCKTHPVMGALLNPRTFRTAFQTIDTDNDDSISLEEFRACLDKIAADMKPVEQPESALASPGARKSVAKLDQHSAFQKGDLFKQDAIDEQIYDVTNFYWDTGLTQQIARSEGFINFTLFVIVANAVYLGVDADNNDASTLLSAQPGFIACELLFFAYFAWELAVRFGAFRRKLDSLRDGWFKFDTFLVVLMIVEVLLVPVIFAGSEAPPTGPLRLLRLLRLSRIVRLLRSFPELATMAKAIVTAVRAVLSSFIMVIVLIYIFAIIMIIFLKEDADTSKYFSTLGRCMWTLLLDGVMGDGLGAVLNLLVHRGDLNSIIAVVTFFLFILLATITVMNMVIGVLCEVVSTVTTSEKEEAATNLMKETILVELKKFDDGDGLISEEELNELMTDGKSVDVLETLGVDVNFLQTMQVMTYETPETTVPIPDLLEQMLMCRQETPATMKHLILQLHMLAWVTSNKILQHERRMNKKLDARFGLLLDDIYTLHHDVVHRMRGQKSGPVAARLMFEPPPKQFPNPPSSRPTSALSYASWI